MPYCPSCGREVQPDNQFCPNCGRYLSQTTAGPPPPATQPSVPPPPGAVDSDASTARTLTLIAIVLQIVFFAIGIFAALFFFVATRFATTARPPISIFGSVFAFGFAVSIIWIALDYLLIYKNLGSADDIPRARTPALILGIVQLIFGGLIPGILLIVAYVKIGDSMRRKAQLY